MEQWTINISKRYCGPTDSGNGGYVSGLVAKNIDGAAQVRLFHPPPLGKNLHLQLNTNTDCAIYDNEQLIAKGAKVPSQTIAKLLGDSMPSPPSFSESVTYSKRYAGHTHHTFPNCYVCGTERAKEDGLRVFTGMNDNKTYVAGPFIHFSSLFHPHGYLKTEEYWAALDCPGAWAAIDLIANKKLVLGTITAEIMKPIQPNDKIIAMGWPIGAEGRKHYVGTALVNEDGTTHAWSHSIWIEIK